jgi:hypothetical protein
MLYEQRTNLCGTVEEGIFDKDASHLIKGFGRLTEGKKTYTNGDVDEGKFDKDTGRLIEGKKLPNGVEINDTDERPDCLVYRMLRGESFPKGWILEGTFDKDTGFLIKGRLELEYNGVGENGKEIREGIFNQGRLIRGKITNLKFGSIEEGIFRWERLVQGKSTSPRGMIEEGVWDCLEFVGTKTFPNDYHGEVGCVAEGTFGVGGEFGFGMIRGSIRYDDGRVFVSDIKTRNRTKYYNGTSIKGRMSFKNGMYQEGTFLYNGFNKISILEGKILHADGTIEFVNNLAEAA